MFNRDTNEIKKSFDFYYTELLAMAEYLEQKEKAFVIAAIDKRIEAEKEKAKKIEKKGG